MTARAIAIRVVVIAVVAACFWWFARDLDWTALGAALANARPWPLVPAIAIAYGMLWFHAIALRALLAPRHDVPVPRLFRYTIVAYAASVIMPLRAGELVRLWLLKQRDGVPVADATAAVVAQKLLDGVTMIMFVAPIPFLLDVPTWVGRTIAIGSAIAVGLFVALSVMYGYFSRRTSQTWLTRFVAGLHVLRSPRRVAIVMGAHLGAWLIDLAMVAFLLHAVGLDLPLAAGLLILFTLNLSLVIPTPANLGALEVGVFAATRLLGVDDEPALAFALLYHASLVVPILVAGFALEFRVMLGRDRPP